MKISAPSRQRRCLAMVQALATLAQKDLGDYHKRLTASYLKHLYAHRLHTSVYSPGRDPPHGVALKQMR
jgi:hypothetical protein